MLKKLRTTFALVFFSLTTLLFLDISGTLHHWFGWMTKLQFVPAVLAHSAVILVGLVVLTLLFGRIYCSVICPLGVLQDGISNLAKRRKGKKNRFRYSSAISWARYALLAIFIVALLMSGLGIVASLLDPYAAFGRIAANFFAPLYRLGNNLFAWFAERANSYAFYSVDVWIKSGISLAIAGITLLVVAFLAWKNGRTYCNVICPVGTVLGAVSRLSLFKIRFDEDKCTHCKICERACKCSCLDAENMKIDYSRCVSCYNCLNACKFKGLKYALPKRNESNVSSSETLEEGGVSRRKALSALALVAIGGAIKAQQLQADGGLADIEAKKIPDRKTPIVPPGAESAEHLTKHCTACQLCISACPNNVLRPSNKLSTLMQPEMSYERGYCRPECVECSSVCPSKAIKPMTIGDKASTSIGMAVWIKDNCIVNTDNVPCDNCARHCPINAISMVPSDPNDEHSPKIPAIEVGYCIGCGACEHLCPARPFSAIYVEGNEKHHRF